MTETKPLVDLFVLPVFYQDEQFDIRPMAWTAKESRDFHDVTGTPLAKALIMAMQPGALDLHHYAAFIWLHKRLAGEAKLTWEEVESQYTATDFWAQQAYIHDQARKRGADEADDDAAGPGTEGNE